jgi:hypothetical protein
MRPHNVFIVSFFVAQLAVAFVAGTAAAAPQVAIARTSDLVAGQTATSESLDVERLGVSAGNGPQPRALRILLALLSMPTMTSIAVASGPSVLKTCKHRRDSATAASWLKWGRTLGCGPQAWHARSCQSKRKKDGHDEHDHEERASLLNRRARRVALARRRSRGSGGSS